MDMLARTGRISLSWFSLTTVVFWLAAIRGVFDGASYEWNLVAFGGRGTSGDYWFVLLAALGSLAVMAAGWRCKIWAFVLIAIWNVLALAAVTAVSISNPDGFRLRGDTMGIDISLAWIGPLLFGVTSLVSVIAVWQVYKHPFPVRAAWNTRNWLWLAGLAAMLPIQFILLRSGEPKSLNDQIGVLITIAQWFLIDRVFRPYPIFQTRGDKSAPRLQGEHQ